WRESHLAADNPRHLGSPSLGGCASKGRSRVCVPASVSIFRVASSCHEIRSRPGTRMIAGAPYALHCNPAASSFTGSHASTILRASALMGTLAASPLSGVTMRQRQSSVTTDTQLPVRSIGAACLADRRDAGVGAGACGPNEGARDTAHLQTSISLG